MKHKLLFFAAISFIMISQSCSSDKDKAIKLAEDNLKKGLYVPNSYKATKVITDSLFSMDGTLDAYIGYYEVIEMIPELNKDIEKYNINMFNRDQRSLPVCDYINTQLNNEKSIADIVCETDNYTDTTSSTLLQKKIAKNKKKIEERMIDFLDLKNSNKELQFAGYFISIEYKAKNMANTELPGLSAFLINKEADLIEYRKDFSLEELYETGRNIKSNLLYKIQEYIADFCETSEDFNIDEFIEYMSL